MKKQRDISKASDLQEHLATREVYQLVNPRKFGTANSRNERQLEKRIKSLHTQQNKRLAKLKDEIDEVRAHHRKLKEVDESARDPRTEIEKNTEVESDGYLGEGGRRKNIEVTVSRTRMVKHLSRGRERSTMNPCNTSAVTKDVYERRSKELTGFPSRNLKQGAGDIYSRGAMVWRPNQSFLPGILDIRVNRDMNLLKRYNYNLTSTEKVTGEKIRLNAPQKKNGKVSELERNTRENHSLITCWSGKKNIHNKKRPEAWQHPELTKPQGQDEANHVSTTQAGFSEVAIDKGAASHEKGRVHFLEQRTGKSCTENGSFPSGDDILESSLSKPSQENWAETLRKCRYLRKPKGYETPEMPIQAIFHYE